MSQAHTTIRFGTFETNSSSSHALVMDPTTSALQTLTTSEQAQSGIIEVPLKSFGWEWSRIRSFPNKLTYLCSQMGDTPTETQQHPNWQTLHNAVQYLTGCSLQLTPESGGGIDHQSQGAAMELFSPRNPSTEHPQIPDILLNFLRNPFHFIETGNDNSPSEETLPSDMIYNSHTKQWEPCAFNQSHEEQYYPSFVRVNDIPPNSVLVSVEFGTSPYVLINGKRVSRTHRPQVLKLIASSVLTSLVENIYDPLHDHHDRRDLSTGKLPYSYNPLETLTSQLSGPNGLVHLLENTSLSKKLRNRDNEYQETYTAPITPKAPPRATFFASEAALTTLANWTQSCSIHYHDTFAELPMSNWLSEESFCYAVQTITLNFWAPPDIAAFFHNLPDRPVPKTAKIHTLKTLKTRVQRGLAHPYRSTDVPHLTSCLQELNTLLNA